jgi:hypothetical protein
MDAISRDVKSLLEQTRLLNARRKQLIDEQATQIGGRAKRVHAKVDRCATEEQQTQELCLKGRP